MEKLLSSLRSTLSTVAGGAFCNVDSDGKTTSPNELLQEVSLLLLEMKVANRRMYAESNDKKTDVLQAKHSLDRYFLQLQNLQYEKAHLLREIAYCKDFPMPELDKIDLIDKASFLEAAPETGAADLSAHQLLMAQLAQELDVRVDQNHEKDNLRTKKKAVKGMSREKEQMMKQLPKVLNDVTAATQPLRSFMPETAETRPVQLRRQAAQLPQPLYTLYGQLSGFNDAFDAGFDFSIVDATKEKSDHSLGKRKRGEEMVEEEEEEEGAVGKAISTLSPHAVEVSIPASVASTPVGPGTCGASPMDVDSAGDSAATPAAAWVIRFEFLPKLHIVTVQVVPKDRQADAGDILRDLFPDDSGDVLPTLCARHAAAAANCSAQSALGECGGKPYRWAQWLAGLNGVESGSGEESRRASLEPTIQTIVRRLQSRLHSAVELGRVLLSVAALEPQRPRASAAAVSRLLPEKVVSTLHSWKELQAASEDSLPSDRAGARVFLAALKHKKKRLQCVVEIASDYPQRAPQFILAPSSLADSQCTATASPRTKASSQKHLASNSSYASSDLQAMEEEVNVYYDELLEGIEKNHLLRYQILRLQMCFDTVAKSAAELHAPGSRLRRGRERRLPFKFDAGSFQMVHR